MKKLPSMNTLPLKKVIRSGRLTILLPIGIMLISSAFLSSVGAQDELKYAVNDADNSRDMLAYVSDEDHLMLYDPHDHTATTLLDNVRSFVLGRDGRVAFTKLDETDPDLYVFDPSTPAHAPINISQNPAANNYPLAWSPDGRYLAFVSFRESSDYSHYVLDLPGTLSSKFEESVTLCMGWRESNQHYAGQWTGYRQWVLRRLEL